MSLYYLTKRNLSVTKTKPHGLCKGCSSLTLLEEPLLVENGDGVDEEQSCLEERPKSENHLSREQRQRSIVVGIYLNERATDK